MCRCYSAKVQRYVKARTTPDDDNNRENCVLLRHVSPSTAARDPRSSVYVCESDTTTHYFKRFKVRPSRRLFVILSQEEKPTEEERYM